VFLRSDHYLDSYYVDSTRDCQIERPQLDVTIDADVVIVGAGYTGLYTALNLAEAGKSVVIIESSRVGWGASGRNGGQIILGFSCDMPPFEKALGLDGARQIWKLTRNAAAEIRRRINQHAIDCDLRDGHLWAAVLPRRIGLLHEWQQEAAHKFGYDQIDFIDRAGLTAHVDSQRYQAALLDREGGHLHPLKYALGLARAAETAGIRIFERSPASSLTQTPNGVVLTTAQGKVCARKAVLACNAYIDRLSPERKKRMLPVGTYMIATEPLGEARAQALMPSRHALSDNQFVLDYFRLSADHRLLFGGKCTYTGRTPTDLAASMRADMIKVFPQLAGVRIEHAWGGHIDITLPRTPDFGCEGDIYWAQGFSGHGVVPTCVAGRVIAEAITGDATHLDLFKPMANPPAMLPGVPGGEMLGGLMQAIGMSYYRLRDYF